jgi:hypothetical protein
MLGMEAKPQTKMKTSRISIRPWLWILILVCIPSISGCQNANEGFNNATATAQGERAIQMATEMAGYAEATRSALNINLQATEQAQQSLLDSASRWPILFEDTFDQEDKAKDWPLGNQDDPLATISWGITGGKYKWEAEARDSFVWWGYPTLQSASDFYLAATSQQLSGPSTGEYGLVYRITENDEYYLFELSADGQFAVFLNDANGWDALLDWQDSDAIRLDGENQMAVIAQGEQFYFFVNGQKVADLYDDHLAEGKVGLLIGLSNPGDKGRWEFDNFEYRSTETPDLQGTLLPTITP